MATRTFPYVAAEVAFGFDPGAVELAYQQEALKDLPIAYWRLREAASPFADLSLYSIGNLTSTGGVTAQAAGPLTGEAGSYAVGFDGTSGYLTHAAGTALDLPTVTAAVWIYPTATRDATADAGIISREFLGGATRIPFALAYGGSITGVASSVFMGFYTGAAWYWARDPNPPTLNVWAWYVGVISGLSISIYKNGTLIQTTTAGAANGTQGSARTWVGRRWDTGSTGPYFPGRIAEPAIYPRAVSPARIQAQFDARLRGNPPSDAASLAWSNLSSRVRQFGTSRGRQHELNRFETGSGDLALANDDRRYEPEYAGILANLVDNPSAEVDATGMTSALNATISRDTTVWLDQVASFRVANSGAGNYTAQLTLRSGTRFPVTVGLSYAFSASVARIVTAGQTVQLQITWYDAGGAVLSTSSGASAVATATYARLSAVAVAPANAVTALLKIAVTGAPGAGSSISVDAIQFEQAAAVSDYVQGDYDNARWAGTRHASQTLRGGPHYPQVIPMRRTRLRAAWPPQLVPNGSFERSPSTIAPWTTFVAGAATSGISTGGDALSAPGWSNRVFGTSPAGGATDLAQFLSDEIPVDPAKPYVLTALFWKSMAGNPHSFLRLQCFNDEGSLLGIVAPTAPVAGAQSVGLDGLFNPATQSAWVKAGGVVAGSAGTHVGAESAFMPGTTYVRVEIYAFYNPAGAVTGTVYVDAVALTPGTVVFANADYYATGDYDANDAWEDILNGFIETWPLTWSRRHGLASVTIVEGGEPLALDDMALPIPQQQSGTRVAFILDAAGWPRSERSIQTGQSAIQAVDFSTSPRSPLTHLGEVAETEGGVVFLDKVGYVRFEDRLDRVTGGIHAISASTFGDGGGGGELPYVDVTPNYGIEQVYNKVHVMRVGGVEQVAFDDASRLQYRTRRLDRSTLHTTDGEALTVAQVLLNRYKQPSSRIDAIRIDPRRNSRIWAEILSRDISHRITIVRRPELNTPVPITQAVHIERISHRVSLGDRIDWQVDLQLSPADTQAYWQLDVSALDTGTRLGY